MGRPLADAVPGTCKVFDNGERKLYFRSGIIGALTESQREEFCVGTEKGASQAFRRGATKFKLLGELSKSCLKADVADDEFLTCIITEARKRSGGGRRSKGDAH